MEAAGAAAAAVRGGSFVGARTPVVYDCARGPRRVVGAGLAAPCRRRALVAVAALPEPLEPVSSLEQDGAMAPAPQVCCIGLKVLCSPFVALRETCVYYYYLIWGYNRCCRLMRRSMRTTLLLLLLKPRLALVVSPRCHKPITYV
jgi:hypothetical protein